MIIEVVTLFPRAFRGAFSDSIVRRAIAKSLIEIRLIQLRDFAEGCHGKVDDRPFGGGPGMVLQVGPVFDAVHPLLHEGAKETVVLLTPQGETFNQTVAKELALLDHLVLICGHYAGVDERVRGVLNVRELSLGDFVCTGGEMAAIPMIDALVRMIPGALGHEDSAANDSFWSGTLGVPLYTRPRTFQGIDVPEVLISGNHREIETWRGTQRLERTRSRRPDLIERAHCTDVNQTILRRRMSEDQ